MITNPSLWMGTKLSTSRNPCTNPSIQHSWPQLTLITVSKCHLCSCDPILYHHLYHHIYDRINFSQELFWELQYATGTLPNFRYSALCHSYSSLPLLLTVRFLETEEKSVSKSKYSWALHHFSWNCKTFQESTWHLTLEFELLWSLECWFEGQMWAYCCVVFKTKFNWKSISGKSIIPYMPY